MEGELDFQHTRLSLRRRPTDYAKVRHALGPIARAWPFKKSPSQGQYLNIGCGPKARPGFFNVDFDYHDGVDLFHDLRKPLPIADGMIAGLFSEHCLEHLEFEDARFALKEFHRVLRPGAVLRLSVPDGETYMRRYVAKAPLPYAAGDRIDIGYTAMMSVNRLFYGSGHRFIYDYETLALLMATCGFSDVAKAAFNEGRDPNLLIDQEDRAVESLYVEAER